ncbi:MAG: DUF6155 family protein [Patescibacteria group bacterium]
MALRDLSKHLRRLPQKQLIKELIRAYRQYPNVREYYDQLLEPGAEERLLPKYKRIIRDEFFPSKGDGKLRFSMATNGVRQFRKLRVSPASIADLLLSYAENGVEFTMEYGDIDERFYETIENKYDDALAFMKEQDLLPSFRERARKLVDDTQGVGWGFHDQMEYLFEKYYE